MNIVILIKWVTKFQRRWVESGTDYEWPLSCEVPLESDAKNHGHRIKIQRARLKEEKSSIKVSKKNKVSISYYNYRLSIGDKCNN